MSTLKLKITTANVPADTRFGILNISTPGICWHIAN